MVCPLHTPRPMKLLGLTCVLAMAAACEVGEVGEPGGGPAAPGPSPSEPSESDIPTNGLVLAEVPIDTLSTRPLAEWADDLVAETGGAELAKYIATCAVPEGESLVAGGQQFAGFYGLAPEWLESECGAECRGWVSACLLAHANARGNPVAIELIGSHASLDDLAPKDFPVQEAAFYGDVFAAPPAMFACAGRSIFNVAESIDSYLEGRICGLGQCGLVSTGACALLGAGSVAAACAVDGGEAGGFDQCRTVEYREPTSSQVITVYLQ